MKKIILVLMSFVLVFLMISCSDDSSSPNPTRLKVITINGADSVTVIPNADVAVYTSGGDMVASALTDINGETLFDMNGGDYYLHVKADNFDSIPMFNSYPDTFVVSSERTTLRELYMRPVTILKIIVREVTGAPIPNANVVVFHAETNQSIRRVFTDMDGVCYFDLAEGNYYLNVTAQSYDPSPAPTVLPVPFYVTREDTTAQERILKNNLMTDIGFINGYIEPPVSNFLILAESASDKYATVTGPDGFFIMYNLPYDTYSLDALKSGYKMDGVVNSTIDAVNQTDSVTILVSDYVGSTMSGSLSFIAGAESKPTDMVLRDPVTLDIIPGMVTFADTTGGANGYRFDNIPDGDFILWASLENDHNVMDPDKNLGGIDVSFPMDNDLVNNIDITGAIIITSPTNPMDSIYAAVADSNIPTFVWEKNSSYSSVKEWIIEVRDINGNKIWGGFDEAGIIQHPQIPSADVTFEYPATAPALEPGQIYQWKIYADNNADPNVQGLLSSSEDLRGIFTVPEGK